MRIWTLSLLLWFIGLPALGQVIPFDSLKKALLRPELKPQERIDILVLLGRELSFVAPDQSIEFSKEALELSKLNDYPSGEANAYRNLASNYAYKSYFTTSTVFVNKAIALFTELKDSTGINNCYITIGHTYKRQGDLTRAIQYHRTTVNYFRRQKIMNRLPIALLNLGEVLILDGKVLESRKYIFEALELARKQGNALAISSSYRILGMSYFNQNQMDSATYFFRRVLFLADSIGMTSQKLDLCEAHLYLARINLSKAGAIENIQKARMIANSAGFSDELRNSLMLEINYYSGTKNYTQLSNTIQRYSSVSDSLIQIINQGQSELLEKLLAVQEMEELNSKLVTQVKENELTIKAQRSRIYLIAVFLLVTFSLLILIYVIYRQRNKLSNTLIEQKQIIEEKSLKLEELNTTKDKFFSVVSHDLRSPFNTLRSFVMLLENHLDTISREELIKLVAELKKSLDVASSLAENLITWARLQMNTEDVNPDDVNVIPIIDLILELNSDEINKKQIGVVKTIQPELIIRIDPDHASFILRNLISNAIKFTPVSGKIYIESETSASDAFIKIRDTGIGMPKQIIDNLFQIGKTRSRRGTAGEKGSGLGLLLAGDFARKNGGVLSVESIEGKGTIFTLKMPINQNSGTHLETPSNQ